MSTEKPGLLQSGNPITIDTAVEWTTNWRNWWTESGHETDLMLKAFYIPISDIQTLAEQKGAAGVRAYLALTEPGNPTSIKVVLVATSDSELVGYGKDMIEPIPSANTALTDDPLVTIYDMTMPCPRYCDPESPLFGEPEP